ncbi:MAG TPA: carbohydrate-binding protein [Kiritimatiellia bacterium]|nr:carbohydrate-binding protein [Kiritimatiellia bacterium]HMP32721.1 carbohydrate-binding protein [Kiritimatiellia bacterium]
MNRSGNLWVVAALLFAGGWPVAAQHPIHVTYQWHMHQPIYYPYESVTATDNNNRFVYSVRGIHDERSGNYNDWPKNAIQQGHDRGLPHAGAQASFSGSLMENLSGIWGNGWRDHWRWARNGLRTSLNNPRLDMVGFAYHHSLMPLTCYESMRMQIRLHKEAYFDHWGTTQYSKGFFPPESSYATHMIPALVDEGIEWVFVDSGHFDRTLEDFPWSGASSIRPNLADVRNGTAASKASSWVQLQNVWAPTPVAAPFSYQPHRVRYVDPNSSPANPSVKSMIAVPAARYEGNENGRGGYGAFKPENVWGNKIDKNNNAQRPMLIVCHSDGDNFGMKNADAWHGQHGLFLNMIQSNPNFEHTTVQDYLSMYPVPADDYIHAEAGSWIGIDGGTPYFDKWVENNSRDGEHPDYWSWSMIIAAQNRVIHADKLENNYSMNDVRWGIGNDTAKAWRYYLQSETSCHWYWDYDRANPWDGNATRGANLSMVEANKVINRHPSNDPFGPSIFPPQRKIWNPGGKHWEETANQPSDFDVWSFIDDVNGVAAATLKWRTADYTSYKNLNEYAHEIYAQTPGKNSPWNNVAMSGDWYPTVRGPKSPEPLARAMRYTGRIEGATNTLVSYYIEAVDTRGNTNRSIIQHVWVGNASGSNNISSYVTFDPPSPSGCDPVTVKYRKTGSPLGAGQVYIHIGRNNWQGTILPNPAMTDSGDFWTYTYTPAPGTLQINVAFNNGAGSWDSNGGVNWNAAVTGCDQSTNGPSYVTVNPSSPQQCQPLVVTYHPAGGVLSNASPVTMFARTNQAVSPVQYTMAAAGSAWIHTNANLAGVTNLQVWFAGPGGTPVDNRAGSNWVFTVAACNTNNGPSVVQWAPAVPVGCDPVTIRYRANEGSLKTAQPVYIHVGHSGWKNVVLPNPAMTLEPDGFWTYTYTPPPGATEINAVFNNGAGLWDNNSGNDWKLALSGCDAVSGVVITTPASNITVGVQAGTTTVSGVVGPDIVGLLRWSNSLTGSGGSVTAATPWSIAGIALGVGDNVITVSGTNSGSGIITSAVDAAANYSGGWTNGANLGTGYGPWSLFANPTAGHFIGANGFGLWAQAGNLAEAIRPLPAALSAGQSVSVTVRNNYILEGQQGVGMALRNASGESLFQFFFNGGDDHYTVSDAADGRSSGIGWTDEPQIVRFTLVTPTTYAVTIGTTTLTGTVNGAIAQLRVWNYNGGVGSNYDYYFDNPTLTSPGGAGQVFADSVTITRTPGFVDSDGDGIDDAWEMLHFGNLTTANATSDWDGNGFRDRDEFRAGTNPKDSTEYLRAAQMEHQADPRHVVIRWHGANGRSYNLYRAASLIEGTYICIGSNLPYVPAMNSFTDQVGEADALFYLIEVQ